MRTAVLSILKNVIILVILVITLVYVFSVYIKLKEFLILFYSTGSLYLLVGLLETRSHKYSFKKADHLFTYMTDAAVAKSIIKIVLYLVVGIVLYVSGSIIKYMAFLCFLKSTQELLNLIYKIITKSMFIYIDDTSVKIVATKPQTVHASDLEKINYRHGLIYLVKHDGKTITVRADVMKDSVLFTEKLKNWALVNKVPEIVEP